jgi:protein phosphatase
VTIDVPDPSLVLLVGPSGAGKSTFAAAHFRSTEVLSSDALRGALADDPNDQDASAEAFAVLAMLLNGRLRRRLLTVVDATNLRASSRRRWLKLAGRYGVPTIAIAFDLPPVFFQAHNAARQDRQVDGDVVALQTERMGEAMTLLHTEGYAALHVFRDPASVRATSVERSR